MKKRMLMLMVGALMLIAGPALAAQEAVKIGVVQITLEHEYQVMLNKGFKDKAAELGVEVIFEVNEMNPEKCVSAVENLIAAGCKAIILAPADKSSWMASLNLCREAGVALLNDGSPQDIKPGMVPFIGTDNFYGGKEAGKFAGQWINDNLGGSAIVAHLTFPVFTDCVRRNDGFLEALKSVATGKLTILEENGKASREGGLNAMENLMQANPDIQVVFGCNDDSALGAFSVMQAAGKDPAKNLVIGFDGALAAFKQIKAGGMFRLDIVQQPYMYAQMHMERAAKLARGEEKIETYAKEGHIFIETPVVSADNVDEWIEKVSALTPK